MEVSRASSLSLISPLDFFENREKSELKLFELFQISLQNFWDLRAGLLKYSHLQPSEIDKLPFYELEELLDSLKVLAEKEEEERKKNEKSERAGMPNFNSMTRQMSQTANRGLPQMPNFKF